MSSSSLTAIGIFRTNRTTIGAMPVIACHCGEIDKKQDDVGDMSTPQIRKRKKKDPAV